MGNVNMEARQVHVRDNNKKTWKTVADALKGLEASGASVAEDITELYTRDSSRASKDDIANEFDAETLYHTGDYVYYEGTLFKFTANHTGEWDQADVVVAQIVDDLVELKSGLINLSEEVNGDATTYPYADVITINDAVPANLAGCMVKIEPVQSGTGTPSPENVRPITGHTEAVVTVADDDTDPTVTNTYTLALGDTIYGGTVDFETGVMTASYVSKTFDENVVLTVGTSQSSGLRYADIVYSQNDMGAKRVSDNYMICSSYAKIDSSDTPTYGAFRVYSDSVSFLDEDFVDVASAKAKLNGVQLVYELATPTTIQLTPEQIQLLQGTNTITASTGDISVTLNGVSGAIGAVQTAVNELAADIAEKLPDAPTTDGAYVLTVTVADGVSTYSWVSGI